MGRPIAKELAHIDALLEQWAAWGKSGTLGWPSMTLLARVIAQGFTGAAQAGPVPEMDEMVEACERAVLWLPPIQRLVIVKHYVHWQPAEVSARYCNMSRGRFERLLHQGRRRIADYIDGRFSSKNPPYKKAA